MVFYSCKCKAWKIVPDVDCQWRSAAEQFARGGLKLQ